MENSTPAQTTIHSELAGLNRREHLQGRSSRRGGHRPTQVLYRPLETQTLMLESCWPSPTFYKSLQWCSLLFRAKRVDECSQHWKIDLALQDIYLWSVTALSTVIILCSFSMHFIYLFINQSLLGPLPPSPTVKIQQGLSKDSWKWKLVFSVSEYFT